MGIDMNKTLVAIGAAVIALAVALWIQLRDPLSVAVSLALLLLAAALLIAISAYLYSALRRSYRQRHGIGVDEDVARLEAAGQLLREHYQAHGALAFEELNTSALVYLLDIGDGRVLCLYGQHYFDYEPVRHEDEETDRPRRFPTHSFSLARHMRTREVIALLPGNTVFEPIACEAIAGPTLGAVTLVDGAILDDSNIDEAAKLLDRV